MVSADSKKATLDEEKKKTELLKRLKDLIRLILSGISTKRFYTCNKQVIKNMKMICYTFKKNPCAGFSISLIGAFTLGYINMYQFKNLLEQRLGINFFYYGIFQSSTLY
jgi:hypothetical protein